jgi:FtsP/CotA-like multicopper oxidase with cupredoxin domain
VLTLDATNEELYPGQAGDESPNCFHGSSTTNIHFHGTHVTPDGLGDNVLLQLRPDLNVTADSVHQDFEKIFSNGPPVTWLHLPETWRKRQEDLLIEYDRTAYWNNVQGLPPEHQLWPKAKERIDMGLWPQYQIGAYPYCFDLTPYTEDAQGRPTGYLMGQCPGTHWYHAHKHGSTAINVMNGMVGAFVIEGDYDDALAAIYPDLKNPDKQVERVMIIHNLSDKPNVARGNIHLGVVFSSPTLLVNGQREPTITMRPGEIQFWRMVNATIKAVTTVVGFEPSGGWEIRQIAQDGVQFSYENYVAQPIQMFSSTGRWRPYSFAPGNRMDLLVKAPSTEGTFVFKLNDTTSGPSEILTVKVAGEPTSMQFPNEGDYPKFPRFLQDIQTKDLDRPARTLNFGWEAKRPGPGPNSHNKAPQFTIDGKKFSGNYDQTMVLNAVEEWTLLNSTSTIAHPFHIHVNPFQVVEVYDPGASPKLYRPEKDFIWQDVIAIPPSILDPVTGEVREQGYVKIRHRFVDFVGSYVLHCHMLAHEDRGMMQLVRVVSTEQDAAKPPPAVPHH